MSDTLGLGKLITTPQQRDAIHIAVAPVTADCKLYPGQCVGFIGGGTTRVSAFVVGQHGSIGIVDPFLEGPVYPEQQFWMWLKPYTITSLRHDWTHPAFSGSALQPNIASDMWLKVFAADHGADYDHMMQCIVTGDYVCFGTERYREDIDSTFWYHVEQVLGHKVDHDTTNFRCAC